MTQNPLEVENDPVNPPEDAPKCQATEECKLPGIIVDDWGDWLCINHLHEYETWEDEDDDDEEQPRKFRAPCDWCLSFRRVMVYYQEHENVTYWFCGWRCHKKFRKEKGLDV